MSMKLEATNNRAATQPPIIFVEEKTLAGVKREIITQKRDALAQVQAFWAECEADGTLEKLRALCVGGELLYGCCTAFSKQGYHFWIAAEVEPDAQPEFEMLTVKSGEHAVFVCTGSAHEAVRDRWIYILNHWFPYSGYAHRDAPQLERYPAVKHIGEMDAADYMTEILVPVVKVPERKLPSRKGALVRLGGLVLGLLIGVLVGNTMENPVIAIAAGALIGMGLGSYIKKRIEDKEAAREQEQKTEE